MKLTSREKTQNNSTLCLNKPIDYVLFLKMGDPEARMPTLFLSVYSKWKIISETQNGHKEANLETICLSQEKESYLISQLNMQYGLELDGNCLIAGKISTNLEISENGPFANMQELLILIQAFSKVAYEVTKYINREEIRFLFLLCLTNYK